MKRLMIDNAPAELKVFSLLANYTLTFFCAVVVVVLCFAQVEAAFNAGRVTVTTSATAIYTAPRRGGSVLICNRGAASIFIGPSTVTTATGFEVETSACVTMRPFPNDTIYGIIAAATARVDYAEGQYREP